MLYGDGGDQTVVLDMSDTSGCSRGCSTRQIDGCWVASPSCGSLRGRAPRWCAAASVCAAAILTVSLSHTLTPMLCCISPLPSPPRQVVRRRLRARVAP